MNILINRIFIITASALLLLAAAAYSYSQQVLFLLLPLLILVSIFLVQQVQYLFFLLVICIPWSVEFNFSPVLGTDLPDEPLMILSAFSVLLLILHDRKIQRSGIHLLSLIIGLQVLWITVTVFTSDHLLLSAKYLAAKSWYILAFVALPVILFKNTTQLKTTVCLLFTSMMVLVVVSLVRHGQWWWSFEMVNDSVRPFFRNHVSYAALLAFMIPVQAAMIRLSTGRTKAVLYGVLAISLVALYFSYSRGAWLSLVTGGIAYWLLKKKLLVTSFVLFFVMVIAAVFWMRHDHRYEQFTNDYPSTIFHPELREHLVATYQLKDLSNAERIYRWVAGIRMVRDSWKTGFGPSTFYEEYKEYRLPAFKTYVSDNPDHSTVHNYFLLLLIEQGVMGCLLFILLIVLALWYCQLIYFRTANRFWKAVAAAVASMMVMQCTINFLSDMIETDKVGSVFYFSIAVIIIADLQTRKNRLDLSPDIQGVT